MEVGPMAAFPAGRPQVGGKETAEKFYNIIHDGSFIACNIRFLGKKGDIVSDTPIRRVPHCRAMSYLNGKFFAEVKTAVWENGRSCMKRLNKMRSVLFAYSG